MKILALDTATDLCSAALWIDGECLTREYARPRGSGELLLDMVAQLLAQAGVVLAGLDMIAVGRGPGAFTGVRLAVAVAQGLGFAAGIPLLPVSDLRALAQRALTQPAAPARALVCQDARMGEVYWGCFELGHGAQAVGPEAVAAPAAVRLPPIWVGQTVCGAGSGFEAYVTLPPLAAGEITAVWGQLRPRALEVAELAALDGVGQAVPPEQAQPVYLRDEVAALPS
ncbi:MAG TPA: tRNA (adenosine(37)-N6)-threonylcarbamoyltransferase complex dimerization subunit type 1 TsaB [Steroidobacteraceae bacterium]